MVEISTASSTLSKKDLERIIHECSFVIAYVALKVYNKLEAIGSFAWEKLYTACRSTVPTDWVTERFSLIYVALPLLLDAKNSFKMYKY